MCDSMDIVDNELLKIMEKYPECKMTQKKYIIFDTSSTNKIIGLDGKYVIKKKRNNINELHKAWYELIFSLLENEGICNIYIKNSEKNFFTYHQDNQYSMMHYCYGNQYSFKCQTHILSVISFIKHIQNFNLSSELFLNEKMLLAMPKQEIYKWYVNREEFEKDFLGKIHIFESEFDINLDLIRSLIEKMDKSGLRSDYKYLKRTLSHGELQGQNLIFDESGICKVLDWDSLSIRPAIYDIAMSACFLCRNGRGRFILDRNLFESYINSFKLSTFDRCYILLYAMAAFLPDIVLLDEYYSYNPVKAKWYLDWSCRALEDITDVINCSKVNES